MEEPVDPRGNVESDTTAEFVLGVFMKFVADQNKQNKEAADERDKRFMEVMFDQNKRNEKATEEWERRFTQNMIRLKKSNGETKSPSIPRFTGHTKNTQDILSHTRRLHIVLNSTGLLKTLADVNLKEERRQSVINLANESLSGTIQAPMKEFKAADKEFRAAKFSPRFQGPYKIIEAYQEKSVYKLDFPNGSRDQFSKFHAGLLKPYLSSSLFGQVSPLTLPLPETDPERYRIHHIPDNRKYRGKEQLRVVYPDSGTSGKWMDIYHACQLRGFRGAYNEYRNRMG
nr:hypothetical protein L204_05487 [Cryptococcus depauperatus CBS 7855]